MSNRKAEMVGHDVKLHKIFMAEYALLLSNEFEYNRKRQGKRGKDYKESSPQAGALRLVLYVLLFFADTLSASMKT